MNCFSIFILYLFNFKATSILVYFFLIKKYSQDHSTLEVNIEGLHKVFAPTSLRRQRNNLKSIKKLHKNVDWVTKTTVIEIKIIRPSINPDSPTSRQRVPIVGGSGQNNFYRKEKQYNSLIF